MGRRLLECSDLSREFCINFGVTTRCRKVGFEEDCNSIVSSATTTANNARDVAIGLKTDAINAKDTAIGLKNDAIKLKDYAISNFTKAVKDAAAAATEAAAAATEATRKFTELGDGIQCALPLQPKGLVALMASRANSLPRRSRIVLTCGTAC